MTTMPKTLTKKARFLHEKSRVYRGQRKVADYKTRANRVERRALRQRLAGLGSEAT